MSNERGCEGCPVYDHGVNWGHTRDCDDAWYATRSKPFSEEEWEKVVEFGFDAPDPDEQLDGMTFPVRFAVVGLLVFVLVLVGLGLFTVAKVMLR